MPKPGFYAVGRGRVPGIYTTRGKCKKQVLGFSKARCKKFGNFEEARAFVHQYNPSLQLSNSSNSNIVPLQASLLPGTSNNKSHSASGSKIPEVSLGAKRVLRSGVARNGSMSKAKVMEVVDEERPRKRIRRNTVSAEGPLAAFFAQYIRFKYNPAASATDEFYRLCCTYRWRDENNQEKQLARQGFQDALTMQFNNSYGTDVDDLTTWQALCAKLGMDPVPESLDACRGAVRHTHVNLVDLVDIFDTPKKAHVFPSVFALSEYTKEHWKSFPRRNAHAGNLLEFLLRQILNPERDDR